MFSVQALNRRFHFDTECERSLASRQTITPSAGGKGGKEGDEVRVDETSAFQLLWLLTRASLAAVGLHPGEHLGGGYYSVTRFGAPRLGSTTGVVGVVERVVVVCKHLHDVGVLHDLRNSILFGTLSQPATRWWYFSSETWWCLWVARDVVDMYNHALSAGCTPALQTVITRGRTDLRGRTMRYTLTA